ncbi:MAG: Glyoxalase/bleomycin resistance protein/dioxygenase [Hydrocarboniphaga sp.]|uniref:VOC family protein n=1 Tax=Hydrocarboniphaga sp. TaxID=2033016 RepID=UPI002627E0CC|nr:VOC family protein [Hydrocarboniphaga sp.]MDB5970817.1 Glyoxalase/bleomycin resistance protein/dioxygenase [Hydrocarboniphaga sp.]
MTRRVPDGYHSLTPYIVVSDASAAIRFYSEVLGAIERLRFAEPGGRIGHAELQLGDSVLMIADEYPESGVLGPARIGGTPVSLMLYVGDVDATLATAVAAGATVLREAADQFHGDRSATMLDPFGHRWTLSTHQFNVSKAEMQQRWKQMSGEA